MRVIYIILRINIENIIDENGNQNNDITSVHSSISNDHEAENNKPSFIATNKSYSMNKSKLESLSNLRCYLIYRL